MSIPLSPRQSQLMTLLLESEGGEDVIAYEMGITQGTVKAYAHALYKRLGVKSRSQLLVRELKASRAAMQLPTKGQQ